MTAIKKKGKGALMEKGNSVLQIVKTWHVPFLSRVDIKAQISTK